MGKAKQVKGKVTLAKAIMSAKYIHLLKLDLGWSEKNSTTYAIGSGG